MSHILLKVFRNGERDIAHRYDGIYDTREQPDGLRHVLNNVLKQRDVERVELTRAEKGTAPVQWIDPRKEKRTDG